jgi:hypothetical protein
MNKRTFKKSTATKTQEVATDATGELTSFMGKRVYFFDDYHGFWQIGDCYKETKMVAHVRVSSRLFKVIKSTSFIRLYDEQVTLWKKPKDLVKCPS